MSLDEFWVENVYVRCLLRFMCFVMCKTIVGGGELERRERKEKSVAPPIPAFSFQAGEAAKD